MGPDLPPGAPGPGVRNGFWTLSPTKREESTGTLCFISRWGPRRGGGTRGTPSRSGSRGPPPGCGGGAGRTAQRAPTAQLPSPGLLSAWRGPTTGRQDSELGTAEACPPAGAGACQREGLSSWARDQRKPLGCRVHAGYTQSQPPPDRETLEWHSGREGGARVLHSWPPAPAGPPYGPRQGGLHPGPHRTQSRPFRPHL